MTARFHSEASILQAGSAATGREARAQAGSAAILAAVLQAAAKRLGMALFFFGALILTSTGGSTMAA
ncbi:MAG: hypothetical protein DMG27_09380 [Acidobacteria bacterium]|nr:MAG: hypothetical protein DMG27_09380 [Acidobacteriota bacterium]